MYKTCFSSFAQYPGPFIIHKGTDPSAAVLQEREGLDNSWTGWRWDTMKRLESIQDGVLPWNALVHLLSLKRLLTGEGMRTNSEGEEGLTKKQKAVTSYIFNSPD